MKILVTGANGFLGSSVVARLLSSTVHLVRCLVRTGSSHVNLDNLVLRFPDRLEIFFGSLNNSADCTACTQDVDMIFHLASAKGGAPAEMFQGSSVATKQLLEAMRSSSRTIKLVHCSSFSVYGVAGLAKGAVVDEETPLETAPQNRDLYSYSKWHQERLVGQYAEDYGIPTVILRPGVIYGPGGSPVSPRVGLTLFGLFLFIGGSSVLPLTHVENCADAFIVAAEHGDFSGTVYNVVDDDLLTAKEYLRLYRENVKKVCYVTIPYRLMLLLSSACEWYFCRSKGQLPNIFTRYKTANMWKGNRYTNDKLKTIGWHPTIGTYNGVHQYLVGLTDI